MKKAVVLIGGKQYLVEEKETLRVDLLPAGTKELETGALLVIDGDKVTVGAPEVKGVKVSAKVVDEKSQAKRSASFVITQRSVSIRKPAIAKNIA